MPTSPGRQDDPARALPHGHAAAVLGTLGDIGLDRCWPIAEMAAGARHGRLPAVNLPPRSPFVNPDAAQRGRVVPMPPARFSPRTGLPGAPAVHEGTPVGRRPGHG